MDRSQDKAFIAGFAPRVSKLAYEGYGRARQVLEESAQYVSSIINSLKRQFSSPPLISLIGGTMQAGNLYIEMIRSRVGNSVQVFPGYQVAIGGILILLNDLSYPVDFKVRNTVVKQMDAYLKTLDGYAGTAFNGPVCPAGPEFQTRQPYSSPCFLQSHPFCSCKLYRL